MPRCLFRNLIASAAALSLLAMPAVAEPPRLEPHGDAWRLVVDGKPMLILGGELGNSSGSSEAYMAPHWARLKAMHLNTVLVPVTWESIEPEEGRFDFAPVDMLIRNARAHDLNLVLLWFGAWKNSMSSYVPSWVKRDQQRFARAALPDGTGVEILTPFAAENLKVNSRAFVRLMEHIKAVDSEQNTVLMMQVENEIGMLPAARDHHPLAEAAWRGQVPAALTDYLEQHNGTLQPELKALWEARGALRKGSWAEVFGDGDAGQEVFTAWFFSRYADAVAEAGMRAYELPMYLNVALNRPGKRPGEYPSGGPLPHLIDVWKAGAPHVAMLSPDIYFPNFVDLASRYRVAGNPMFVPEANNADDPAVPANGLYAFGQLQAFGFSPFAIEGIDASPGNAVGKVYGLLEQLTPAILDAQGTGRMAGFKARVLFDGTVIDTPVTQTIGNYRFTATFIDPFTDKARQHPGTHGALVIQTGAEDYLVAGSGVTFTFQPATSGTQIAGIDFAREGQFDANGEWREGRWLNGDQTHQGRHIRLEPGRFQIQKIRLYRYR